MNKPTRELKKIINDLSKPSKLDIVQIGHLCRRAAMEFKRIKPTDRINTHAISEKLYIMAEIALNHFNIPIAEVDEYKRLFPPRLKRYIKDVLMNPK